MVTTEAKLKKTLITPETTVCSNDDLLTEILSRLPAKSILRFKSVSKHWLSLLSQRHFTLLYDNRLISSGLFFRDSYFPFDVENPSPSKRFYCSLNYYLDPNGINIMQSCNGLLLCSGKLTKKYYVFNPATRQFAVVPPYIDRRDVGIHFICMGLAYHPIDCVHFKIVYIYGTNENLNQTGNMCQIHIYSSETGERKILQETFYVDYCGISLSHHGVYWNRAIIWPTYWNGAIDCTWRNDAFYFKLDTEQFKYLSLPEQGYCTYFGESRGHLHLVKTAYDEKHSLLKVYEMLTDHSGWFVKYRVDLDELVGAYPEIINKSTNIPHINLYDVIDVVRGEEEEDDDMFMVVMIPKKIIRYNVVDKTSKPISDLSGVMHYPDKGHRYIESIGSF